MSGVGFRVRAAGVADLAGVVEMEQGIAEAPHWTVAEYDEIVNADGDADETVRRCLVVAEAEGRLLGFAVGKVIRSGTEARAESIAELESVAVEQMERRRGVAKALCGAVIAWSISQGAVALELEVRAGSDGAIALYLRVGFVAVGRRRAYYQGPVDDALVMRLELG